MSFTFNTNIPAAANDPSVDQPDMLTNNVSTKAIIAVDHLTFDTANGGNHLQVHLPLYTNPTIVNGSATQGSVLYGAAGVADTAHAQCYFKNANNIVFQMSGIRAWAFATAAGITASQSVNVASIVRTAGQPAGDFTITLTANATSSANYAVILSSAATALVGAPLMNYGILSTTQFRLQFRALSGSSQILTDPTSFSFLVLQL